MVTITDIYSLLSDYHPCKKLSKKKVYKGNVNSNKYDQLMMILNNGVSQGIIKSFSSR